jgi:choline dehydrogenase
MFNPYHISNLNNLFSMSESNKNMSMTTVAGTAAVSGAVGFALGVAYGRSMNEGEGKQQHIHNHTHNHNNNNESTISGAHQDNDNDNGSNHSNHSSNQDNDLPNGKGKWWRNFKWDHIVVGLGSAGPIIARELSDQGYSVLVIEAGTDHRDDPVVLESNPAVSWKTLTFDHKYAVTYGIPLTNTFEGYTYTEGRGWGGGMMHNYVNCVHGSPANVYNAWAAACGDDLWKYENVAPLIRELETYTPNGTVADYSVRGNSGPIKVTQFTGPIKTLPGAIALANKFQVPFLDDLNNPTLGDCGAVQNQRFITPATSSVPSHRSYSALEFLGYDVVDRNGEGLNGRKLKILSNAYCNKVLLEKRHGSIKATGVNFVLTHDGTTETLEVHCSKYVTLCAGSFHSPAILERSGIGSSAILNPLQIPVIVNNPNVGANLNNQYGAKIAYTSSVGAIPAHQIFTDLRVNNYMPADGKRRVQLIINPTSLSAFVVESHSQGTTHINSRDPLVNPSITMNFWNDGDVKTPGTDAYIAVSTMKAMNSIPGITVTNPPAATFAAGDVALWNYLKTYNGCAISNHGNRTCKMGASMTDSVVDSKLNVFGVTGLKVADMSICPTSNDGNNGFNGYVVGKVAKYTY